MKLYENHRKERQCYIEEIILTFFKGVVCNVKLCFHVLSDRNKTCESTSGIVDLLRVYDVCN